MGLKSGSVGVQIPKVRTFFIFLPKKGGKCERD